MVDAFLYLASAISSKSLASVSLREYNSHSSKINNLLFQAMRKNRQEPFWIVPAVVYIVLPDSVILPAVVKCIWLPDK